MGANGNRKNTVSFDKEIRMKTNNEYQLASEYIYSSIPVLIKHNICGNTFSTKPVNFIRKTKFVRCPYCSQATNKRKTTIQFKNEIKKLVENEYELIGEYKNNSTKIEFLHCKCHRTFFMKPLHFVEGERCPYCSKNASKFEQDLIDILKKDFPQYTFSKVRRWNKEHTRIYEIDIFIKELNIGFEYNGTYWHSTIHKDKDYHITKRQVMLDNGITLFYLWEHWGKDFCINIIKEIITLGLPRLLLTYPYIKSNYQYIYINKDLFPNKIENNDFLEYDNETIILDTVYIKNKRDASFQIYNSGYWIYKIKAL